MSSERFIGFATIYKIVRFAHPPAAENVGMLK